MAFISGRDTAILFKQYVLSTYFKEVQAAANADEVDVTAFGATPTGFRKFIGGMTDGSMSLSGFFDAAATGSDFVLNDALDDTAAFAVSVAPLGFTLGNACFLLKAVETNYTSTATVGDAVMADADLVGGGGSKWGRVLHTLASSGPYTGSDTFDTGQDNPSQAASTKGAAFHLHVTVNSTAVQNTQIRIQDSADNMTFADTNPVMNFAAVAVGTLTSERLEFAAPNSLRRYLRVATKAGGAGQTGNITFTVTHQRNL